MNIRRTPKPLIFASLALVLVVAVAQQGDDFSNPNKANAKSRAYHNYRLKETEPTFQLAKVKNLVKNIKPVDVKDTDNSIGAIPDKVYRRLSVPAKFTYCMLQAENYGQNCDGMPAFADEEKRIFAFPLEAFFGEKTWSDRQTAFLHNHRTQVIKLLRQTIQQKGRIGVNLKRAITEIDAVELIPDLIANFKKDHKDLDDLSTLSVLLKHKAFLPYLATKTYHSLYGEDSSYQTSVPYSKDVADLIIASALQLYKQKKT